MRNTLRMFGCLLLAVALLCLLWLIAPQQSPVVLYKLCLLACAAYLGYWIDRSLFPYSRPDGYLAQEWRKQGQHTDAPDHAIAAGQIWPFICACFRRAAIVIGAMLAVSLGL